MRPLLLKERLPLLPAVSGYLGSEMSTEKRWKHHSLQQNRWISDTLSSHPASDSGPLHTVALSAGALILSWKNQIFE